MTTPRDRRKATNHAHNVRIVRPDGHEADHHRCAVCGFETTLEYKRMRQVSTGASCAITRSD